MRRHEFATELLAERRAHLVATGERSPTGTFEAHQEVIRQHHIQAVRQEIARREVQLTRLDEEREKTRLEVAEAHRALKAMDILEEHDREEWVQEAKRAEQAESDERTAQRFERD